MTVWLCSSRYSCLSLALADYFCAGVDGKFRWLGSGGCGDGRHCGLPSLNDMEYSSAVCGLAVSCASSSKRCARKRSLYLEVNKKQTCLVMNHPTTFSKLRTFDEESNETTKRKKQPQLLQKAELERYKENTWQVKLNELASREGRKTKLCFFLLLNQLSIARYFHLFLANTQAQQSFDLVSHPQAKSWLESLLLKS